MLIASIVSVVRPRRSAKRPPATHPIAPMPMVAKVISLAAVVADSPDMVSAKLDCRNTPIHAHIAYNSHMWPR